MRRSGCSLSPSPPFAPPLALQCVSPPLPLLCCPVCRCPRRGPSGSGGLLHFTFALTSLLRLHMGQALPHHVATCGPAPVRLLGGNVAPIYPPCTIPAASSIKGWICRSIRAISGSSIRASVGPVRGAPCTKVKGDGLWNPF